MTALREGTKAPDFSLPAMDGSALSLQAALLQGPVVAAFFKISCPVCQYTFPYLERLHKAYGSQKATILGISQDDKTNTAAFLRQYGVTFPALLDDPAAYVVSNAYGLTNVPSWFFIVPDGEIKISSVGWVKADIEDLNRRLADANHTSLRRLFHPGESVRDSQPG